MFDFHKDKDRYFDIQYKTSRDYIIPFISEFFPVTQKMHVLEIGCAEAGVLKAFTELGHKAVGIELSASRTELAKEFMASEMEDGLIRFINSDVYDIEPHAEFDELFDVVILKDVIEHIPNQQKFIEVLKSYIKPTGIIFFGFPPWYMPFGGHQQIAVNKWASKLPYYHILPTPIYKWILKLAGETDSKIDGLLNIKSTGITIERFESITKNAGWEIAKKLYWLTNPIYQWKFGIKARKQFRLLSKIPFLRNFWTTAVYYVIKK